MLDSSVRACSNCLIVKPLTHESFRTVCEQRKGRAYSYTKRVCRVCEYSARVEYGRKNRERQNAVRRSSASPSRYRHGNLKKNYGITLADYDALLAEQGGVCAICARVAYEYHRSGRLIPLAVDHDHSTGRVRGLLCGACNRGLGDFRENGAALLNAASYLRKHQDG